MVQFMNKIFLIAILLCAGTLNVISAENKQSRSEIKAQQRKVAQSIFELRKVLIQSDPKLLELHNQKIKIHRQISERISGNPKMAELIEEAISLQVKLDELDKAPKIEEKVPAKLIKRTSKALKSKKRFHHVEPKFESRMKKETTPKVIDKTADTQIESEEDEGLSYE